jgi:ElaB/YqjD/DUF883 family membrane-anchored ribosome-binding protein
LQIVAEHSSAIAVSVSQPQKGYNVARNENITAQSLQNDLMDLKAEILELSRSIGSTASDAMDRSAPALEATRDNVRQLANKASEQGRAAVEVIRDNPGITSSVALSAGLIGLTIGYLLGSSGSGTSRRIF